MADHSHDLLSILSSPGRDYLARNSGDQVELSSLKGKKVGLYFSASWCGPCHRFTPKLVDVYNGVSSKGDFEIVFISADEDDESFNKYFSKMPWLAVPFSDSITRDSLNNLFKVRGIPNLVLLDEVGNVLTDEGVEIILEYGVDAYPFTVERVKELKEQEEAARRNQSLRSILVSQSRDYVISADGKRILVSDLVGKTILLYFSAHWCPPCRGFTPKLVEVYHKIKSKHDAFEIIFISSDRDQTSFDKYYSEMPWLALPFGDERKASLSKLFQVRGIPKLVAIAPTGQTVTTEARNLVMLHGADGYPFTEQRLKEIEAEYEELAKGWPQKVKSELHVEHELVLTRCQTYMCDDCDELGTVWAFNCAECNYDLHPKCALGEDYIKVTTENDEKEENSKEGWVCDGEVCHKA